VVIEEFLQGEEASFIVLCDGKNVTALATSQDHKRLLDGDQGPNTGGMGAYSPAPVVTPDVHARAMREIILPTIRGMEKDGIPYTGFLYAGLMIDKQGHVKTLEFNCRMGDPETQPIMMRLKSDLFDVMLAATSGTLDQVELQWDRRTALGVVMAAAGYPLDPRKGDAITGLPRDADDAMVFHAGTAPQDGQTVTTGGRVLCVTALADTVKAAQQRAYEVLRASASTAPSTAATSATAPSRADGMQQARRRPRLPARPAAAHHAGLHGDRRQPRSAPTPGARTRASRCRATASR
jgi:phosphoribosylamine--glycine ligase